MESASPSVTAAFSLQKKWGSEICEAVFPSEGSGWDMEANALIKKENEKEISKSFLDWAISDNVMKKYATNYPIVATGASDNIPEGYSQNPLDQLIPDMDFNKAAKNRESILEKAGPSVTIRKSAPEE